MGYTLKKLERRTNYDVMKDGVIVGILYKQGSSTMPWIMSIGGERNHFCYLSDAKAFVRNLK